MREKLIEEKRRIESLLGEAKGDERLALKVELENVERILSALKGGKVPVRDTSNDVFFQILAELRSIRQLLTEKNNAPL